MGHRGEKGGTHSSFPKHLWQTVSENPRKSPQTKMTSFGNHFETMIETIVGWYLQGSQHSRVSERWCEMDLVHPQ